MLALGMGADEFKGRSPTAMMGLARWEQGHEGETAQVRTRKTARDRNTCWRGQRGL